MATVRRAGAAALLLFAASGAFARQSADVAADPGADLLKAVNTLNQLQLVAAAFEGQKSMSRPLEVRAGLADSWGTPLRISVEGTTYRVVSAGSDQTFDEKSWSETTQFTGTAGDLVLTNGRMTRSNRNWLTERATAPEAVEALKTLSRHELMFMVSRTSVVTNVSLTTATVETMQNVAKYIERYRAAAAAPPTDAWGTPMRLVFEGTNYRLVSAGSDREFQQENWDQAGVTTEPTADIVMKNGQFTRRFDAKTYYTSSQEPIAPVPQPPDPSYAAGASWARVGGDVKPPVVIERVTPVYPEEYRKARVSGLVILEAAIDASGAVENLAVLKSVGADMDLAAKRAVSRWKFQPATRGGVPVPVLFNLTINFQLNTPQPQ